jgi:DNA-binding NarL/FixJ family response regulator
MACSVVAFVIAKDQLAAAYLCKILARTKDIKALMCAGLPPPRIKQRRAVFVLNNPCPPIPLGECLRRIRSIYQKARFIVVDRTLSDEECMRLLALGVHGFVGYTGVEKDLGTAVRSVSSGGFWTSSQLLERYVESIGLTKRSDPMSATPREAEVLELVRQRFSNKEIADLLGVRESTVKYHVSNIFGKLHISRRTDLTRVPQDFH